MDTRCLVFVVEYQTIGYYSVHFILYHTSNAVLSIVAVQIRQYKLIWVNQAAVVTLSSVLHVIFVYTKYF